MVLYNQKEKPYLEKDDLCRARYKTSAIEGRNVVPKELSTWQCSTVGNGINQQKFNKHRNLL